ncbi:TetR/AcrR family transcriptional regulator [Pseudoclavibacter chungangensis]|uniref:TetR/AcrR family transcriptional regulator n=1 Tax=Pseudoclavibacter chungangensis TaxID=587635 RepID=A0A7J5C1T2_9MICO|nr:TetR/AcrR family transcriptional regulator [Pseudoclavibacter chungangensis]KAB1662597.1 TetR/AcrR family transcriptional regulator [Pseudoclavibacter chungangensis]NYJ68646.1 AcrR family transcriptional regulator [Pseudoclavibacter chungangensis]
MTVSSQTPVDPPQNALGRAALLRATIDVGLALGLSGITSRSVAEAAGVAHSLVRYHFGSVDALITEALSLAIDEGIENARALAEVPSLTEFTRNLARSVTDSRDTHAFLYEAILESRRRPELVPQVKRYYREYREALSAPLRALGVEDEALLDMVLFAFEGMVFKEVTDSDQRRTREAIRQLRSIVARESGVRLTPPADDDWYGAGRPEHRPGNV